MSAPKAETVLQYLRHLAGRSVDAKAADEKLLERFVASRDEAAFAELVSRHGPMVLGVCRRVLGREQDAEDAFQASFMVLSEKAHGLRKRASLASWLHGVARRTALNARVMASRRQRREHRTASVSSLDPIAELSLRESLTVLDEELAKLPAKYQAPLVLCCLEGRARDEAAHELGWPLALLKSRLEQAREKLRGRLTRRGLTLPAGLFAIVLTESAAVSATPATLVTSTAALAATGASPPRIAALAKGVVNAMFWHKVRLFMALVLLIPVGFGLGIGGLAALGNQTPVGEVSNNREPLVAKDPASPVAGSQESAEPSALDRLDGRPGEVVASLSGHRGFVEAVATSPDGKWLASSDSYGSVLLWDTGDLKKPSVLKKPTTVHPALWDDTHHVFRCLAFSPDSRLLVGAGPCVQFWDVAGVQPKEKTTIERPKNSSVWSMAFSPDGKTLAINGDAADGWDTRLLDLLPDKPKERARLAQIRPFSQFAFSPDGKCLACVGWTEGPPQRGLQLPVDVVTIWDVATGKERARIKGFGVVDHMAYSPDGHALAVGLDYLTNKETLRLYDIRGDQPKQLAVLPGHKKGVRFVGFLPDAKSLVSVGFDGHIILWDISPGKMVALQDWESATPASVMHVALAADGRHLAVACRHNTVQIMRIR